MSGTSSQHNETNDSKKDAAEPDTVYIERVTAIQDMGTYTVENATILKSEYPATARATSKGVDDKINIKDAVQTVLTYDRNTQQITEKASRNFADCLLYMWVDFYERDPSELDLDVLYEIAERVPVNFDYTFDKVDESLEDRINTILNIARCVSYTDTKKRFNRDEKKDFENALITRKDIAGPSNRQYGMTFSSPQPNEFDSLSVQYINRAMNKPAFANVKIDSAGVFSEGFGNNAKQIVLKGCQDRGVALNRAHLEVRKMAYKRWSLTDTVSDSHQFLTLGDNVLYEEVYENFVSGGEIEEISGNVATLSEPVPDITANTVIYYSDEFGSVQGPFTVSKVSDRKIQFNGIDAQYIFTRDSVLGNAVQVGSRYTFNDLDIMPLTKFTVEEKASADGYIQLTMSNYDERVYELD